MVAGLVNVSYLLWQSASWPNEELITLQERNGSRYSHSPTLERETLSKKKKNGFVGSGSVAFMKYQWPQYTVLDIKVKDFHSYKRTHLFLSSPFSQPGIHPNPEDLVTSLFHSIVLSEAYEGWDHMIQTHSCRTFNKDWKVNADDSLKKYHREGLVYGLSSERTPLGRHCARDNIKKNRDIFSKCLVYSFVSLKPQTIKTLPAKMWFKPKQFIYNHVTTL